MHTELTLPEIQRRLKLKIIGQDQLIESVLTTIQLHSIAEQADLQGIKHNIMSNLLIIGNTGTGKTFAVKEAAHIFGYQLIELNAKEFGMGGSWYGKSIGELIDQQWVSGKTYAPIILIDEIDKIMRPLTSSDGEDVNASVQQTLLKYLEGMKTTKEHDLSHACFIFAGAFTGMLKERPKHQMGFFSTPNTDQETTHQKLLGYGMIEELLGRINRIVVTNSITKEMLYTAFHNNHNVLNQYRAISNSLNLPLMNKDINIDQLINAALKLDLGFRGLNQLLMVEVDKLVKNQFFKEDQNHYLNKGL